MLRSLRLATRRFSKVSWKAEEISTAVPEDLKKGNLEQEVECKQKVLRYLDGLHPIDNEAIRMADNKHYDEDDRLYIFPDINESRLQTIEAKEMSGRVQFFDDVEGFEVVPTLNSALDPIIKYPGLYRLEDMKSAIGKDFYEFYKRIPQPHEIDMKKISNWKPPSLDNRLVNLGKQYGVKFVMSTSSISSVLSQMLYLISNFKEANYSMLYSFTDSSEMRYMSSQKKGSTCFLRRASESPEIWALDSDSGPFEADHQILMDMGHIIEKMCTMEPAEFEGCFLKSKQDLGKFKIPNEDYHRLMKIEDDMLIRSQLDCQGKDLEGNNIVFEIKSRALAFMRYRVTEYYKFLDYPISKMFGVDNSYEREYYDMIRGAFAKYFKQMHIGRMHGGLVFYHSTFETIGFEYVKLPDIKEVICESSYKADAIFYASSKLTTMILNNIIKSTHLKAKEYLKVGFSTHQSGKMTIMTEIISDTSYEEYVATKIPVTENMASIKDFYMPRKDKIKARKYEFVVYPKINGVPNAYFFHEMTPKDSVEINYTFKDMGPVSFEEYMQFLLNCDKEDKLMPENAYGSNWFFHESSYKL